MLQIVVSFQLDGLFRRERAYLLSIHQLPEAGTHGIGELKLGNVRRRFYKKRDEFLVGVRKPIHQSAAFSLSRESEEMVS